MRFGLYQALTYVCRLDRNPYFNTPTNDTYTQTRQDYYCSTLLQVSQPDSEFVQYFLDMLYGKIKTLFIRLIHNFENSINVCISICFYDVTDRGFSVFTNIFIRLKGSGTNSTISCKIRKAHEKLILIRTLRSHRHLYITMAHEVSYPLHSECGVQFILVNVYSAVQSIISLFWQLQIVCNVRVI